MNPFRTPNLPLAAFLRTRGAKLIGHDRQGKLVYFIFENFEACHALRQEYMLGNPVEKVFMTFLDDLRDLIHTG